MKLNLTTEQINQILNALAEQPYIQVHELIATIQQQGSSQLQEQPNGFQEPPHIGTEPQDTNGEIHEHLAEVALETATNGNG